MKYIYSIILCSLFSCSSSKVNSSLKNKVENKAQSLIEKSIKAHGGKLYQNASYAFTFRKKRYHFTNHPDGYSYSATFDKDGQNIKDQLVDELFMRKVNGEAQVLSEKDVKRYSNSLNSVIYFATLPYKLNDPAVHTSYIGTTEIKGKVYEEIEVRFSEENGGDDHDDIYHYWIDQKTFTIDYLAYKFHVNDGGVRFRSAYNPRTVSGIRFQDYVNYKAPKETGLNDLPRMFEAGNLVELSRIETENVELIAKN